MKSRGIPLGVLTAFSACVGFVLSPAAFAAAPTGVLKWTGGGNDWKFSTAANWESLTSGKTVADLQAAGVSTRYDFTELPSGSVVTNDFTDRTLTMHSIICSGAADDVWTLVGAQGSKVSMKGDDGNNPTFSVTGGKLIFNLICTGSPTAPNPRLDGGGTLVMVAPTFSQWQSTLIVNGASRLIMDSEGNANFANGSVKLNQDQTVFEAARDFTVASLPGNMDTSKLQVNDGVTLTINGGHNTSPFSFYGDVLGGGVLQLTGGHIQKFYKTSHSFAGTYRPYTSDLMLGTKSNPASLGASATLDLAGGGNVRAFTDQSVAILKGAGNDGAFLIATNGSLTVTGSGAPTNTTLNARLIGQGSLVKKGADYTLTLSGANAYAGTTDVREGTLALSRPISRRGLIGAWSFENAANLGEDSSANGVDLRVGTAVVTIDDGIRGKAVRLNGTKNACFQQSAKCILPESFPQGNEPHTVSFWYRATTPPSDGNAYMFFRWGDNGGGSTASASIYAAQIWYSNVGGGDNKVIVDKPTAELYDGKWHHIAYTYAEKMRRLYLDGVEIGYRLGAALKIKQQYGTNDGSSDSFYIGRTNGGMYYNGDLDEFQVYNREWTADEVAAEYASLMPVATEETDPAALLPTPVAHWKFDDASDLGKDSGPYGYHLTNVATNKTLAAYAPLDHDLYGGGGTVAFSGYGQRLQIGTFPEHFPTGNMSFTVAVRCARIATDGSIIGWGDPSVTRGYFNISGNGSSESCPRKYRFRIGTKSYYLNDSSFHLGYGASSMQGVLFTQMTAVYHGASKTMYFYRDGQLVRQEKLDGLNLQPKNLFIGFAPSGASPDVGTYQNGERVDDVRVFDVAMTAGEVATLAKAYRTGAIDPTVPAASTVSVASGATLAVTQGVHRVSALTGAGSVSVGRNGRLAVGDITDFTGSFSGAGEVTLEKLSVDASAAGSATPLVDVESAETQVSVAAAGTLAISGDFDYGSKWLIADRGRFHVPADVSGWTVTPSLERLERTLRFVVQNGKLYLWLKPLGSVLLVR